MGPECYPDTYHLPKNGNGTSCKTVLPSTLWKLHSKESEDFTWPTKNKLVGLRLLPKISNVLHISRSFSVQYIT